MLVRLAACAVLAQCWQQRHATAPSPAAVQRRSVLGGAFAAAVSGRPRGASAKETAAYAASLKLSTDEFYVQYPFRVAADVVTYLEAVSREGDAEGVIRAMETFGARYPMYSIGPIKGLIVDDVVRQTRPSVVLEIGSFLGYSAVRIASQLPPGARMLCVPLRRVPSFPESMPATRDEDAAQST